MDTNTNTKSTFNPFHCHPSLRDAQQNARDRQAREIGPAIPESEWHPITGLSAPASGLGARWHSQLGWLVVARGCGDIVVAAPLPDLPASWDHPIVVDGMHADSPVVVGGDRRSGRQFWVAPLDLCVVGIFFDTADLAQYRDGGSWVVRGRWKQAVDFNFGPNAAHDRTDHEVVYPEPESLRAAISGRGPGREFGCVVIAAVESALDPSRPGQRVFVQREPLVVFEDGRRFRLRFETYKGDLRSASIALYPTSADDISETEQSLLAARLAAPARTPPAVIADESGQVKSERAQKRSMCCGQSEIPSNEG